MSGKMSVQTDKTPIISSASEYDCDTNSVTGSVYSPTSSKYRNTVTIVNDPPKSGKMSKKGVTIIIAVINVVANVLMNVSLPVFAGTMDTVGGDTFVVLLLSALFFPVIFFLMALGTRYTIHPTMSFRPGASIKILFLMGLFTTLNGIFVVFASPPDRTPPYLQGILATTSIPYTVVCRYLILRKGISMRRLVCVIVVLIGLFITVEPQIWGLPGSGESGTSQSSGFNKVFWPMIFALGFLPVGIMGVLCEKELQNKSESLTFAMYTQVFQLVTMLPLFWVDFIPHFGMATSIDDFGTRVRAGLTCCFSSAASCNGLAGKLWLFFTGYSLGNLFQYLLIEYAEGAVYAVVVQSMVTPLATLFWTVFTFIPKTNHFFWNPQFNITTGFTLGGLLIIVPTIVVYNYFSKLDSEEKDKEKDTEKKIKDIPE